MRKKDLVGKALNDLLVNEKFDYITTGVPPHVLEARLAHAITVSSGEADFEKVHSQAKSMIAAELKNEGLKSSNGNYFHGPKKSSFDTRETQEEDEYEDDEDEDDDEERGSERDKSQDDVDYAPYANFKNRNRGEGRTSARMKKSRYDSDEYVYPTILKNLNKRLSPAATPVKNKPPRRRPGPKPRKRLPPTICSICRNSSTEEEVNVTCKSCPAKAHSSCVDKDLGPAQGDWICSHCTPPSPPNLKGKCQVCLTISSKELGILVTCETCSLKYHKKCHTPAIESGKNWQCVKCCPAPKQSPSGGAKRPLASEDEDSKPSEDLLKGQQCYGCKSDFPNPVDKLLCSECKMSFHSGCCRVRNVHNISRLGCRKNRWRCDKCKIAKAAERTVSSCMVVIPRLSLKRLEASEGGLSGCSDSESPSSPSKTLKLREKAMTKQEDQSEGSFTRTSLSGDNSNQDMDVEDEKPEKKPEVRQVEKTAKKEPAPWWHSRLRPIIIGKKQPPLGPIPDLTVPDITHWSSNDVQKYFDEYFLEPKIGLVFVAQDIDGKALKLMRKNDVISVFENAGFNLDVILDVMQHVKRLQLRVNDRRYIWADIF